MKRPVEAGGLPGLKIETWGTQLFGEGQMWATRPNAILMKQGIVFLSGVSSWMA